VTRATKSCKERGTCWKNRGRPCVCRGGMIQDLTRNGKLSVDRLEFSAGQVVFQPEDPATRFFLVESGEVRIFHVVADEISRLLDILAPMNGWSGRAGPSSNYEKRAIARTDSCFWLAAEIPAQCSDAARGIWPWSSSRAWPALARRQGTSQAIWFRRLPAPSDSDAAGLQHISGGNAIGRGISLHMTHAQLAQAVARPERRSASCLNELRQPKYPPGPTGVFQS